MDDPYVLACHRNHALANKRNVTWRTLSGHALIRIGMPNSGNQAVLDADVPTPHEKIVYLLGRLRFRTSYSQNVLAHSVEVAHLCGLMASELGLNTQLARRCGLLHDVGKAADHEMEGGHPKVGAELARRYGETSKEVLHAIADRIR